MKKCNFCHTTKHEAHHSLLVCNHCMQAMEDYISCMNTPKTHTPVVLPKPHEIKAYLDQYVIGQEDAKKILSVCVYHHYQKIAIRNTTKHSMNKTSLLLAGPTGSGKTYMIQKLQELIQVPMVIVDASGITKTGYVGQSVDSMVKSLYLKANQNIEKAQEGIIFIDEFDKLAKRSSHGSLDIGGESVQQELLKMIEGTQVTIKIGEDQEVCLQTSNILFILGGAFEGLERVIEKRTKKEHKIGFGNSSSDQIHSLNTKITHDDLIQYGFLPELIGRIPLLAQLSKLSKADLVRILTHSKGSVVHQYQHLFQADNTELVFQPEALEQIAQTAINRNIGARGLNSIIDEKMVDLIFESTKQNRKRQVIKKEMFLD